MKRDGQDKFQYKRVGRNVTVEKLISIRTKDLEMEVVPIHPLFTPSYKTEFMFLRLLKQVFVSRNSTTEFYASVPIEIGLFFTGSEIREYFDVFSCEHSHSKYALYGDPDQGKLCKFAKVMPEVSDVVSTPFIHGNLKIVVDNQLDVGVSMGKVVFPLRDHDVYYAHLNASYDDLKITLKERLGIQIGDIVQHEDSFKDGWTKSPRTMKKTDYKFSMEKGFD